MKEETKRRQKVFNGQNHSQKEISSKHLTNNVNFVPLNVAEHLKTQLLSLQEKMEEESIQWYTLTNIHTSSLDLALTSLVNMRDELEQRSSELDTAMKRMKKENLENFRRHQNISEKILSIRLLQNDFDELGLLNLIRAGSSNILG